MKNPFLEDIYFYLGCRWDWWWRGGIFWQGLPSVLSAVDIRGFRDGGKFCGTPIGRERCVGCVWWVDLPRHHWRVVREHARDLIWSLNSAEESLSSMECLHGIRSFYKVTFFISGNRCGHSLNFDEGECTWESSMQSQGMCSHCRATSSIPRSFLWAGLICLQKGPCWDVMRSLSLRKWGICRLSPGSILLPWIVSHRSLHFVWQATVDISVARGAA